MKSLFLRVAGLISSVSDNILDSGTLDQINEFPVCLNPAGIPGGPEIADYLKQVYVNALLLKNLEKGLYFPTNGSNNLSSHDLILRGELIDFFRNEKEQIDKADLPFYMELKKY